MEHKFGEMKEQLKKELKEEMQQLTSPFEESKEKIASVSKKMEQIANEIKPMKSKLSEVHDEIFLPDAMTEGGIEYFCRKTARAPKLLHTGCDLDGLTVYTAIQVCAGRNRRNHSTGRWKLVLC